MPSLHPTHPAHHYIKIAQDDKISLHERYGSMLLAMEQLCVTGFAPEPIFQLWEQLSELVFSPEEADRIESYKSLTIETIERLLWHRRPFDDDQLSDEYQSVDLCELPPNSNQRSFKGFQPNAGLEPKPATISHADRVSPQEFNAASREAKTQNQIARARDFWVEDLPYGKFVLAQPFDFVFDNAEFEAKNPAKEVQRLLDDISDGARVLTDYVGDDWIILIREMSSTLERSGHLDKKESVALCFLIDGKIDSDRRLEFFSLLVRSLPSVLNWHGYFVSLSRFVFTPILDALLPEADIDADRSLAIDVYNLFSPILTVNESLSDVIGELLVDFSEDEPEIVEQWSRMAGDLLKPDFLSLDRGRDLSNEAELAICTALAANSSKKYSSRLDRTQVNVKIDIDGKHALNGRATYFFAMACANIFDHLALICGDASRKYEQYELLGSLYGSKPLEDNETIYNGLIEAAFLSHKNYSDEYLAGGSDISLFDLSDILYRYHIVRRPDHDHLVTPFMSLGMVLSLLTDNRFVEIQYNWRNRLPSELDRMGNPQELGFDGWLRQRYLLDVVDILRDKALNGSADAVLGYFLVTEALANKGKWFFLDECMRQLSWAIATGSGFSSVCSAFCIEELKRNNERWLARRVKESLKSPNSDHSSLASLVDSRAALYRYEPEEEAARVLGSSVLGTLSNSEKERVVNVFTEVQALIASQSVYSKKDFGSAVMVFFRFFEDVLGLECKEAFLVASNVQGSGINKPKGEPTFGNYIRLINRLHASSCPVNLKHALNPTESFFDFYPVIQRIADFGRLRNSAAHGSVIKGIEYWKFHDVLINEGYFKSFVAGYRNLFSVKDL